MKNSIYFLLFFAILFTGCSKDDDDPATNPGTNNTTITINSPWQYSLKLGGTSYSATEGVNNFQGGLSWSSSLTTPPDTSSTTFGSGLSDNNSINKSILIYTGYAEFFGIDCDTNKFKSAIHTGNYIYNSLGYDQVSISFIDSNGEIWGTDNGTGDQTGSTFTITDVARVGIVLGNLQLKYKATFNCKLYNMITGASMTLTDGVYVGKVENYN